MWLQEVEGRVFEQFLQGSVALAEADGMQRQPPVHRDLFDGFVFSATAVAVGEADWHTFPIACLQYISAVGAELNRTPPLIPPDTAAFVAELLSEFQPFRSGDKRVDGVRISEDQQRLAERLFYGLGGDRGDGAHAAGARVRSRMMSARISDGFVHPVIGGHMWSDVPAAPRPGPGSGPEITVLESIDKLVGTWTTAIDDRPRIEREILTAAQSCGWKCEGVESIPDSGGAWYVYPPWATDDGMHGPHEDGMDG